MDTSKRDRIIDERLGTYRRRLRETNSTPICCLGVGHGAQSGQLVVCALEDIDDSFLQKCLLFAASEMAEQRKPPIANP